jgi:hypothetical protein
MNCIPWNDLHTEECIKGTNPCDGSGSTKRTYTVFGKLSEDNFNTVLLADVPKADAINALNEKQSYLRGHGFKVRRYLSNADNLPHIIVTNPVTLLQEAYYWIRES